MTGPSVELLLLGSSSSPAALGGPQRAAPRTLPTMLLRHAPCRAPLAPGVAQAAVRLQGPDNGACVYLRGDAPRHGDADNQRRLRRRLF